MYTIYSSTLFIHQIDIKGLLVLHLMLFKICIALLIISSSVLYANINYINSKIHFFHFYYQCPDIFIINIE